MVPVMPVDGGGEVTLGEIYRKQLELQKDIEDLRTEVRDRHHALASDVTAAIGPIATLGLRMKTAEDKVKELDRDMKTVTARSAWISGAGAALAFVASLVTRFWGR